MVFMLWAAMYPLIAACHWCCPVNKQVASLTVDTRSISITATQWTLSPFLSSLSIMVNVIIFITSIATPFCLVKACRTTFELEGFFSSMLGYVSFGNKPTFSPCKNLANVLSLTMHIRKTGHPH